MFWKSKENGHLTFASSLDFYIDTTSGVASLFHNSFLVALLAFIDRLVQVGIHTY